MSNERICFIGLASAGSLTFRTHSYSEQVPYGNASFDRPMGMIPRSSPLKLTQHPPLLASPTRHPTSLGAQLDRVNAQPPLAVISFIFS